MKKCMKLSWRRNSSHHSLDRWYPSILEIFYRENDSRKYLNIVTPNMQTFFQTICHIMSGQLCDLIKSSLDHLNTFFTKKPESLRFLARLVLDSNSIYYEPEKSDLIAAVEVMFDSLLTSLDRIPKLESQLIAGSQRTTNPRHALQTLTPSQCVPVNFEQ